MPKAFSDLPSELVLLILEELPIRELVSCRRLTRSIRELIESNSSLQYKIELAAAGMEDGVLETRNNRKKLKLLHQHQLARDTFRDELVKELPMPVCDVYDLCGTLGVFIRGNKLTCVIPPSPSKGTPERKWEIEHDVSLRYCCCDLQQDLLILVDTLGDLRKVYLRSLATYEPHPRAQHSTVLIRVPHTGGILESEDTHARVFGAYLAIQYIMFSPEQSTHLYTFNVINWNSGQVVYSFDGTNSRSFAFVDPEHLALVSDLGCIEVISVHSQSPKLVLELPQAEPEVILEISIRSDERPPVWEPNDDPFHVSRTDSLLLLDILLREDYSCDHRIIIPTWKLRAFLPITASDSIKWENWGPQNTLMLQGPFDSSSWSSVFGSRYLTVESGQIVMYDFHPFASRPPRAPLGPDEDRVFFPSREPYSALKSSYHDDDAQGDAQNGAHVNAEEATQGGSQKGVQEHTTENSELALPFCKYTTAHSVPADASLAVAENFVVEYRMMGGGMYEGTIIAF